MPSPGWTVFLSYSDFPEEVIHAAVRSFYNIAGCIVGGSEHTATATARKVLSSFSGPTTSHLLGTNTSSDATHAALFNGIDPHVHEYDDTHLDTIIHPTGPVACALLAIILTLSRSVSGPEFITALVAGIEAECKLGLAIWPAHYDIGWHITSTTRSIGAAVAVAKLFALDAEQVAYAIGLAATQVTRLREMFGSHAKSFHPGWAAQNASLAALLGREGVTTSVEALEAKRGWANVVCPGGNRLEKEIAGLGGVGRWEIVRNALKPFPCGIVVHPVIDGCVWLHGKLERLGVDVPDVHPLVVELTGKTEPRDGLETKFSVYYGGAVGLLLGKVAPGQYEDDVVLDTRVVALGARFRAVADGSLRADECHLAVKIDGEASIDKHVDYDVGRLERPMTNEQLTAKFVVQCIGIMGEGGTDKASQWCWSLEKQADVSQVKVSAVKHPYMYRIDDNLYWLGPN